MISDWDLCFLNIFWKVIFKKAETLLSFTTVYHSQADEQLKRMNQKIEIALRCLLLNKHQNEWKKLLLEMKFVINIFESWVTEKTSFKTLYTVLSCTQFISLNFITEIVNVFLNAQQNIRKDVNDMLQLSYVRMSLYYDVNHQSVKLQEWAYLHIVCKVKVRYKLSDSFVLTSLWADSFNIIKWVDSLVYHLKLLSLWRHIHSVISVIHLEQVSSDFFNWQLLSSLLDIVNDQELHIIECIIDSCVDEKRDHIMRVQWEKTIKNENIWKSRDNLWENCRQLVHLYKRQQQEACQLQRL